MLITNGVTMLFYLFITWCCHGMKLGKTLKALGPVHAHVGQHPLLFIGTGISCHFSMELGKTPT